MNVGMRRLPGLAVLALAIGGNVGHRARAVEGDAGNQILEAVGPHLAQHVAHALAFELEHAAGIAPLQHLVGWRVIQRQPRRHRPSMPRRSRKSDGACR